MDHAVTERPMVSIGVPTRDRASLLERALASLTGQDYPNLEIIVSDNASTDQTPTICARLQERYPFVRYEPCPVRIDALENFKRVLLLARGRYFTWASDDDLWAPTFVSTLVHRLEADPDVALAAAEAQFMLADGTRLPFFREGRAFYEPRQSRWRQLLTLVGHNYGNLFYGLYRREALLTQDGGTVLDGCRTLNEIPLFISVAWRGKIVVCRDVLFFKTARLATYLQAAREYGVTPALDAGVVDAPPGAGSGRPEVAQPWRRVWTSLRRVVAYHAETLEDIRRALWRLDAGWATRIALWVAFGLRLTEHLLRIVVVWPAQDALRHLARTSRRHPGSRNSASRRP
jgi:glycosyltransferase involved in cell wall biosynthesis